MLMLIPGATQLQAQSGAPPVELVSPAPGTVEPEGKVTLQWQLDPGAEVDSSRVEFELQQASSPEFTSPSVRYIGRDRGSVLTGFPAGEYHFRVRSILGDAKGAWSAPVAVTFEYVGMRTVWVLVSAGALMFFITVGAIGIGHSRAVARTRDARPSD